MANASQIASPGVYVTDDVGLEVTDGSNSRVQLGLLPTGTYGLRVVAPGGSTVIIDGTSDMFRIAATGTLTKSVTGGSVAATSVQLSGLGTFSTLPYFTAMTYQTLSGARDGVVNVGSYTLDYVAASSGGAATSAAVILTAMTRVYSTLDGSNFDNINMDVVAYGTGTYTGNCRYYVLEEAGI